MMRETKEAYLTWISFFTTLGTLLCCTLPSVFVLLGLGTVIATITLHSTWLVNLSEHKFWIFLLSGLLILLSDWLVRKPNRSCPTDPKLALKCQRLNIWNIRILRLSMLLWFLGFISAYLVNPIAMWLHTN